VPRLRELILQAAERDVREMEAVRDEAPWLDDALDANTQGRYRQLELNLHAARECDLLSGAGEALGVEFRAEAVRLVRVLGPVTGWDGTEAGLDLILESINPAHVDGESGDARGKRAFVRKTVPLLHAAGVTAEEILEVASKPAMTARLAWAVSAIVKNPLAGDAAPREIRGAVADARTMSVREFEAVHRQARVPPAEYDEWEVGPGVWVRQYPSLDEDQRRVINTALRAKQERVALSREPITVAMVRRAQETGDWGMLYRAVLPPEERQAYGCVEQGAGTVAEVARALIVPEAKAARVLTLLERLGLVELGFGGKVRVRDYEGA